MEIKSGGSFSLILVVGRFMVLSVPVAGAYKERKEKIQRRYPEVENPLFCEYISICLFNPLPVLCRIINRAC